MELDIINIVKNNVAKRHGYSDNVLGTRWEYAMMLTHRTKCQIKLYEEVLIELINQKTCNCSVDETTGNSKIKCCNICGKPLKSENWF